MSAAIQVGNLKVSLIFELDAGGVISSIIPDATPENIKAIPWLYPNYADENGKLKANVQSFVIETNGKNTLIDTCVGDGRKRPELPAWSNLHTDYLKNLTDAGFKPEDIDMVICTHLHFDHVGWNAHLVDGQWKPTFPNARYVFVEDEFNYWMARPEREIVDDHNGIDESVRPVADAGLVDLVKADAKITDEISLIPSPGHTPYHASVLLESGDQTAVITGDTFHHPCQIAHPEWMSFDTLPDKALASRKMLLERFGGTEALFIGSHFALPAVGRLIQDVSGYRLG